MPGVQADLIVRDRATDTIRKVGGEMRRLETTTVSGAKRMNAGLASVGNEIARLLCDAILTKLRKLQQTGGQGLF